MKNLVEPDPQLVALKNETLIQSLKRPLSKRFQNFVAVLKQGEENPV